MKAIRVNEFGEPAVMQLEEVQEPAIQDQQIYIDVKAIGVNPVDTYIRSGTYPAKPALPYTPGHDAAGIVTKVGRAVTKFKVGDRVYSYRTVSGSYAQAMVCHEDQAFLLPEDIGFDLGAALGVAYSTAFFAMMHRGCARPGETVLVHGGSGTVGLAAIQYAKQLGMTVIATAGTEAGIKFLQDHGCDHVANHHDSDYCEAIMMATGGRGVDLILEMIANVNLDKDLKMLAHSGRVVIIGNRGTIEINPRDTMGKNTSIIGLAVMNATSQQLGEIHALLHAGLTDGRFKPVISKAYSLAEAAQAHHQVMQPGNNGKIIMMP